MRLNIKKIYLATSLSLASLGLTPYALHAAENNVKVDPVEVEQVYKWQDEQQLIHYTQTPPTNKNAVRLGISTRVSKNPTITAETKSLPADIKPTRSSASMQLQFKAEECAFMKSNLEVLQSGRRLYERDDNGERAYLTDEQKSERIQTYNKNISQGCQ